MSRSVKNPEHPLTQLLLLFVFVICGLLVALVLGSVIDALIYGKTFFTEFNKIMTAPSAGYVMGFKVFQMASTIGMFMLPPIMLAFYERQDPFKFLGFNPVKAELLALVCILMFVSMPAMEWVVTMNQNMKLPVFLRDIEEWMRDKEDEMLKVTKLLLSVNGVTDIMVNILMIAILPAIAEELMFRSAIQKAMIRLTGNIHAGIWIAAIIFSVIHMQFYGFFPRMLLGVLFGYLYVYGGSIWYPILGHFINNGMAVMASLYMQYQHIPIEKADKGMNFPVVGSVISLIITLALLEIFRRRSITRIEEGA